MTWKPGDRSPDPLAASRSMIRVDQAGEYGATRIYAGQLAVMGHRSAMAREIAGMALQEERHGYDITQRTKAITGGQVMISPGTMYGTLSKMEKDGLIVLVKEEDKRKFYRMTDVGREVLDTELARIERFYRNSKGESYGN